MELNQYILIGYGAFLLTLLFINFLYFFQVFKYRFPGDASLAVLTIHIVLMLTVLIITSLYIASVT